METLRVNEFELIDRYFRFDSPGRRGVQVGIGDDCAVLELPPGEQLLVSMDTLVAGVHFPADAAPDLIAERAVRVNLSDLAACGAEALWATLSVSLPESNDTWLSRFSSGLRRVLETFDVALVGGDTTRGPLSITLQVHGCAPPGQILHRNAASPGDAIYVTGYLGDAAAALAALRNPAAFDAADRQFLYECYYRPRPRLSEARALRGVASAAIDISDGLLADLGHICRASGVGADLQYPDIPVSPVLSRNFSNEDLQRLALSGGDDYQLCFTVPESRTPDLQQLCDDGLVEVWRIGMIAAGDRVRCWQGGREVALPVHGYQHFGEQSECSV